MALENLTGNATIDALDPTNPEGQDSRTRGDDHIRGIKNTIKNTFPNIDGVVTASLADINAITGSGDFGLPGSTVTDQINDIQDWLIRTIGMVCLWPSSSPPDGWLECNGQPIDQSLYPRLFQIAGAYTPDLRGRFVRGYDRTGDRDRDGIRPFGTLQQEQIGEHSHWGNRTGRLGVSLEDPGVNINGPYFPVPSPNPNNSWENRPANVCLLYVIKHDDVPPNFAL